MQMKGFKCSGMCRCVTVLVVNSISNTLEDEGNYSPLQHQETLTQ